MIYNYPKFMYDITRRPKGAMACDLLSQKGRAKPGTAGFPSGHMTSISLFAVFMILGKYEIYRKKNKSIKEFFSKEIFYILTNIGIILITAWARYYKNCHSIFQIVSGIILGSILAYIFVLVFVRQNILGIKKLN